jgi:hypothetical protein
MNVDEFLASVDNPTLRIALSDDGRGRSAPETLDALFYMPLLALTILVSARKRSFRTMYMGRIVSSVLTDLFIALRRSTEGLETSLTLRRRCAEALAFLESAQLVTVSDDDKRFVVLTESGNSHLARSLRDTTDLGLLMRRLGTALDRGTAREGRDVDQA